MAAELIAALRRGQTDDLTLSRAAERIEELEGIVSRLVDELGYIVSTSEELLDVLDRVYLSK